MLPAPSGSSFFTEFTRVFKRAYLESVGGGGQPPRLFYFSLIWALVAWLRSQSRRRDGMSRILYHRLRVKQTPVARGTVTAYLPS
jgi:hypothetical protein